MPHMMTKNRIDRIRHPHYIAGILDWQKFRTVFEGGRVFIETYAVQFSARETAADFTSRKKISYSPSHAKAAIIDVRNAIFQRMADISRRGGPLSYRDATMGLGRGVDLKGNSMNSFLGRVILEELLVLGRIAIYVDKPEVDDYATLRDKSSPYLYYYSAEDIRSWHYNAQNQLDSVLLMDHFFTIDKETGLITGEESRYRLMTLVDEGVRVQFYQQFDPRDGPVELVGMERLLKLGRIPMVILELSGSLLQDVADYQIALLNLASSDMNYALKSNYPFYTEQYSPTSRLPHVRGPETEGTSTEANKASTNAITTGVSQGRAYPKGLERPAFIHPSAEPLKASMEKQSRLIEEIRQLVNLALSNIKSVRASAESKQIDNQGLEAGLSYIGLELQYGEREVAKIWAEYEGSRDVAYIKYPDNYELRTDKDRRQEAKELEALKESTPSVTYKKEICKQIATVTVGSKVSSETLDIIWGEIDAAVVVETDTDTVRNDHEAGFVSTETASKIRGYPKGESKQAAEDHVKRLTRIAAAQSSQNMASRGVRDLDPDVKSPKEEKAESRVTDQEETTAKRVRGDG